MRNTIRLLSILLAIVFLCGCSKKQAAVNTAPATEPLDAVVAVVNGEEILNADYIPYRQQYLNNYLNAENAADDTAIAYLEDAALTACIQDILIQQDMYAHNCFTFDEATTAWLQEAGTAAYEAALLDVQDYLRSTLDLKEGSDLVEAAKAYAEGAGVTAQDYIDVYSNEYAYSTYCAWLMEECPITDADIEEIYNANVADGKARFESDVVAYETAIAANEGIWYQPSGYRSILQILLKANGETEEEKLASVQDVLDNIYTRLENGEDFTNLIAEFGSDANFQDAQFLETGYSVHPDSIIWDDAFIAAAFSEDLSAPGTWSTTPLVSDSGVHILYYLKDAEGGPVALTDDIREALSYNLYQRRLTQRQAERLEELSAAAEVTYPSEPEAAK